MHVRKFPNSRVPIKIWGDIGEFEPGSPTFHKGVYDQVHNMSAMPCVFRQVAIMPDTHQGFGVCIGGVLALKDAICPNAVGVDIGCGMLAWNTGIHKSAIDIDKFMLQVTRDIPVGFSSRTNSDLYFSDPGLKSLVNLQLDRMAELNMPRDYQAAMNQLGTLGGGNHFWELQEDREGTLWVMIHSGSRGIGAKIAKKYHALAEEMCEKWYTQLPTKELAFLPTGSSEGQEYIFAMQFAQDYALANRLFMLRVGQMILAKQYPSLVTREWDAYINIHHNFAALESHWNENVWVHRKGATLVRTGVTGIIPGSMCTKSYIVKGKGNPESFHSCSHGSGRRFSRTEAKRRIEDGRDSPAKDQLGNVKVYGAKTFDDELASAYKNVEDVMSHQTDLVEIVTELTPLAVLKGGGRDD